MRRERRRNKQQLEETQRERDVFGALVASGEDHAEQQECSCN